MASRCPGPCSGGPPSARCRRDVRRPAGRCPSNRVGFTAAACRLSCGLCLGSSAVSIAPWKCPYSVRYAIGLSVRRATGRSRGAGRRWSHRAKLFVGRPSVWATRMNGSPVARRGRASATAAVRNAAGYRTPVGAFPRVSCWASERSRRSVASIAAPPRDGATMPRRTGQSPDGETRVVTLRQRGGGIFPVGKPRLSPLKSSGRSAPRRTSHAPLRVLLREVREGNHPDAVHR